MKINKAYAIRRNQGIGISNAHNDIKRWLPNQLFHAGLHEHENERTHKAGSVRVVHECYMGKYSYCLLLEIGEKGSVWSALCDLYIISSLLVIIQRSVVLQMVPVDKDYLFIILYFD